MAPHIPPYNINIILGTVKNADDVKRVPRAKRKAILKMPVTKPKSHPLEVRFFAVKNDDIKAPERVMILTAGLEIVSEISVYTITAAKTSKRISEIM